MGDKGVYIYSQYEKYIFFVTILNKPVVYGNHNKIDFGDKPLANWDVHPSRWLGGTQKSS